jgi:hypothetical protein
VLFKSRSTIEPLFSIDSIESDISLMSNVTLAGCYTRTTAHSLIFLGKIFCSRPNLSQIFPALRAG